MLRRLMDVIKKPEAHTMLQVLEERDNGLFHVVEEVELHTGERAEWVIQSRFPLCDSYQVVVV